MPRLPGGKDIITQPLYDSATFVDNTTTTLTFFNTPLGSGTTAWGGSGSKTLVDTNMVLAGQLPSPWTFEIFTVQIQLAANIINADAVLLMANCSAELVIGAKTWLQVPGIVLSGGAGIDVGGTITAATGSHASHNGIADPRAVFALSRPITILENENFGITMRWNAAVDLAGNQPIRILMGGELSRGIQ